MAETEEKIQRLKLKKKLNMELLNHFDFQEDDQHKKLLFYVRSYRDCKLTALVFAL